MRLTAGIGRGSFVTIRSLTGSHPGHWLWAVAFCLAFIPRCATAGALYEIRYDHWTAEDERGYREFVQALGEANCRSVNDCLHDPANTYRASDPPGAVFDADCADFAYVLRFYYAWKRGLPFSYADGVAARGGADDIRYSPNGNVVTSRRQLTSGTQGGLDIINTMRDAVSSATYRIHPDLDGPLAPDLYPVAIDRASIQPGTLIYDPNGHVAVVYRVDPDGRVRFFDSHTDYSLARSIYDPRFTRVGPSAGAGFKNWRPQALVGAVRQADGTLRGGHIELARNARIADFSTEQFFGNGPRPADANWASGTFTLNGEKLDYYDYVRARLSASGELQFDPVKEVHELAMSNCADLQYRMQAVDIAIAAGMQNHSEPDRLPANIYGTNGDWETFSTPSRDARLKTAFKEMRDTVERFVTMYVRGGDPHLHYLGDDMVGDLLATYRRDTQACELHYVRSDGSAVNLTYEDAVRRMFALSFDPYQCVERRWGATDAAELSTCHDSPVKQAWYAASRGCAISSTGPMTHAWISRWPSLPHRATAGASRRHRISTCSRS
jgi:hypothetical protein